MKKYTFIFLISLIMLLLQWSCTPAPQVFTPYTQSFKGNTHHTKSWANQATGYHEWDSTYIDTIQVHYFHVDSIGFERKGSSWHFKRAASDTTYTQTYGTHTRWIFTIDGDSLHATYHSYGGFGAYFNQEDIYFHAKK